VQPPRRQSHEEDRRGQKGGGKPKADRANKWAEVIAMMKRAKGAALTEIMAVTKWHLGGPAARGERKEYLIQSRYSK
jgi:hypothetical protein